MFGELCELSLHQGKTHKPLAVTVSAIIQAGILAILVLMPLLYTQALRPAMLATFLVAPPPPPPAPAPTPKTLTPVHHLLKNNQLTAPAVIPRHVEIVREEVAPALNGSDISGGVGDSSDLLNSLLSIGSDSGIAPPAPKPAPRKPVVVGGNVQEAKIVRRITPLYPPIARAAHVSGTVILRAIISKDGSIEQLQFVSGPPLLMKAAMDAVKEWKYSPTLLNGEPVEVETTISVIFSLGN